MSFIPNAIGSQNRNISHQLPAAASQMRRPRRPQLPPLTYCSMSSAREPNVSPSQNINANSQECRNKAGHLNQPIAASTENSTPTMSEVFRIRWMLAGGAKSAGVNWLIACLLAAWLRAYPAFVESRKYPAL